MIKFFKVLLCLFVLYEMPAYACRAPINLQLSKDDDTLVNKDRGKAPLRMPIIYQDGYTLGLPSYHPDYLINIVKDEEIVFTSVIPAGVTEFELPKYLEGVCIIQLIIENSCYTGYINLENI